MKFINQVFQKYNHYSNRDSLIALVSGEGSSPRFAESVFLQRWYTDKASVLRPSFFKQIISRW